ncbi:MAG TPA: hypothetical protein P5526_28250 [Anaerolineae bacterium]|nr:hypothetical protein [Anaerolineales bacterium]HRV96077.1 hypothetical protein [Anaerolineae bacterium]
MNAVNQYVEVGQQWIDGQVKIGQGLFESIQGLKQFDAALLWDKSIEAYQAAIQGNLDVEIAGTRILFDEVAAVNNVPAAALDLVKQMEDMTAEVAKTQQTAVDNWFNLLRQIDVKGLPLVGVN